jgi:hypothetical protein
VRVTFDKFTQTSNKEVTMTRTIPLFIAISILLLTPLAASCGTLTVGPSDCSDVAVNNAIASANNGDTVRLTCSGTTTWNNTVTIPNTKAVTIMGPGINTPKSLAKFPLIIVFSTTQIASAIQINCQNNMPSVRITGLKFQGSTPGHYIMVQGSGMGTSGLGAYRIDNCYFDTLNADTVIYLNGSSGELTGLTDNCTFHDCYEDNYSIRVRETYKGSSSGCYGYDSWQRPFNFGDNHFHFIEDCLFEAINRYNRHYVSCDGAGGRYVVRHCTLNSQLQGTSPDYIDAHGDGTQGLGTGTRGGEIYGNTFMGKTGAVGRNINLRGGQFLIYNNSYSTNGNGNTPIHMTEYRASTVDCWECQNPSLCNPGVPQCATLSDFSTWYPLPGQIRKTYLWNNTLNGVNQTADVAPENYVATYIQAKREYFVSSGQPAALAGYTPYIYPHPLIPAGLPGSGPAAEHCFPSSGFHRCPPNGVRAKKRDTYK